MSTTLNRHELTTLVDAIVTCAKGKEADPSNGIPVDIKPLRIPLALHGMHGIGKTESVAQLARDKNFNFCPLYLSTQDVSDLLGIPYTEVIYSRNGEQITEKQYIDISAMSVEEFKTLSKDSATRFATPDWLADALKDPRPCVFFLDEMNRAEPYVLQTMLPFVLEGTLHTHKIRENDIVVAAMNPETAEYNVESIDDQALLSRFCHAYYEPDASEWKTYSNSIGVHPAIMAVVEQQENIINKGVAVEEDLRIQSSPDRRSLTKLGLALQILDKSVVDKIGFKLSAGMVGKDIASMVIAAYNTVDHITVKNIFDGTIFTRKDINFESDLDRINTLMDQLVVDLVEGENTFWKFADDGKPEYTISKKQMENLRRFLEKSPNDAQFSFVRSVKMKAATVTEDKSKQMRLIMGILTGIDAKLITRAVPNSKK